MDPWSTARDRYRRMAPAVDVLAPLGLSSTSPSLDHPPLLSSVESQQRFLEYILRDPLVTQYPPSAKYTSRLLKILLDSLGSNFEAHEGLLELYFEKNAETPTGDGAMRNVIHKSWTLTQGNEEKGAVTIRMADQLDSVGLTSWQAGFMLADFISANPELFEDRKCLELGSGVGLTGIVLAKLARPQRLCLTDYTHEVLANMRTNAAINGLPELEILQLDWEQFESDSLDDDEVIPFYPDVILAADCVYDTGLVEKLCIVLRKLLSRPSESQQPVAYIATTLRNPKTFQFFMDQLKANNLQHEDVSATSKFANMFEQPHNGIILSRIVADHGSL